MGAAINLMILLGPGAGSLGVFNQIYAIFVISGQIAVLGLHDSALKHASEFSDSPSESHLLSVSALAAAILAGLVGASLLALLSGIIERIFESAEVGRGVLLIAPGLFLFTVNKVLMGILNGRRRMTAFAIGQSIRALSILLVCGAVVVRGGRPSEFGIAFTVAEIVLILFLLFPVRPVRIGRLPIGDMRRWMSRHVAFGSKALVHGFLSEAFIRIDILMLGIFLTDRLVGIYSFAALFLEGAYQVSIVVRTITNPILVRLLMAGNSRSLAHFTRRTALLSFAATLFVSAGIVVLYPHLAHFMPGEIIGASYGVLLILMAGLVVFSICVPFDYIFLQAGRPGMQSIYMAVNTLTNATLNILLIPHFGLYGAGIATAVAFIWSGVFLNILASGVLGLPGGIFLIRRSVRPVLCARPRKGSDG